MYIFSPLIKKISQIPNVLLEKSVRIFLILSNSFQRKFSKKNSRKAAKPQSFTVVSLASLRLCEIINN